MSNAIHAPQNNHALNAQGWVQLDSINLEHHYRDGYPACGWDFDVNLTQPQMRCSACEACLAKNPCTTT